MQKYLIPAMLIMSSPALAQLSLSADSEPSDKAWKKPATLAYTRNGDGSSSTTIDAYLKYAFQRIPAADSMDSPAKMQTWSIAAFIHKDNGGEARKYDRGVEIGYTKSIVTDYDNFGPVMSLYWKARASVGKSLQLIDDKVVPSQYADKTKDRQRLSLGGYLQPAKKGAVPRDDAIASHSVARPFDMYFLWETGLYSDHSAGGKGGNSGRLSGGMAAIEWNLLPFGMIAADNRVGGYGVVPVVTLAAQVQRDFSANGVRKKDTYKLYSATLTLEFDTIVDAAQSVGKLKPSLNFTRSIGADLLGGRPYEGKTEISFGLTF